MKAPLFGPGNVPANKTPADKAKKIRSDFREGENITTIAKRHSVSWKTVRRITDDIELNPKSELTNLEINRLMLGWI